MNVQCNYEPLQLKKLYILTTSDKDPIWILLSMDAISVFAGNDHIVAMVHGDPQTVYTSSMAYNRGGGGPYWNSKALVDLHID